MKETRVWRQNASARALYVQPRQRWKERTARRRRRRSGNSAPGIVVEPTEDLLRLQQGLLDAVAPFTEKTGTAAAFVSTAEGRDIQQGLIEYVANFATVAAGKKFNPHVTIGVAPEAYLNEMLAEPFEAFTFSPVGAAVYQLGSFGAARKELQALSLTQ